MPNNYRSHIQAIDQKHFGGGPAENVLCNLNAEELNDVFELADVPVPEGLLANEYIHEIARNLAVRLLIQNAVTRLKQPEK